MSQGYGLEASCTRGSPLESVPRRGSLGTWQACHPPVSLDPLRVPAILIMRIVYPKLDTMNVVLRDAHWWNPAWDFS